MISNKKFVNINIQPSSDVSINATRDTMVLLTNETGLVVKNVSATTFTFTIWDYNANQDIVTNGLYNKVDNTTYIPSTMTHTLKYLDVFFKNGGLKCKVVTGITYTYVDNTFTTTNIENAIKSLDDELIIVAYADCNTTITDDSQTTTHYIYQIMSQVAEALNNDNLIYGINEKLILASSLTFDDTTSIKNFIAKYSFVEGAEMTIGAYLTQINAYGINTIQDYMFTKENISPEELSNENYDSIINNCYNVDITLQDVIRNCGGNDKDGDSIINNYTRIILHQTLTDRLISLLTSKIKGVDGVSKIYATIVDELERYIRNGYLVSDIYDKETLVIDNQVIITKGTPLPKGYYVKILPMSTLTSEQRKNGYCPPIYIVIADQYSIRVINIEGEVI